MGPGRPPRGSTRMSRMLRVRLTEDEWNELAKLASTDGLSVSEYARRKSLGCAEKRGET